MEKDKEYFMFLFNFLKAEEKKLSKEEQKQVMIEKVINLKLMCDYAVSCSYGDLILIICMLRDYVKLLDEHKGGDITYQAYYRKRFLHIADKFSEQVGYDYDAAIEKCIKKMAKEDKSDVGEDAMALADKYSGQGKKKKEDKCENKENSEEHQD